jgi:Gas vesicle protein
MTVEPRGRAQAQTGMGGHEPANLGDILERVLDRGIVIVGDIRISLLDIELLTVKLRLLIASVDTARELGIDWWQHDPWLSSRAEPSVNGRPRQRELEASPPYEGDLAPPADRRDRDDRRERRDRDDRREATDDRYETDERSETSGRRRHA